MRATRKVVDGVMMEVQAYGPEFKVFRAAYPRNGVGVYKNTRTGRIELPLDWTQLDEEGWSRVRNA